MRDLIVQAYIYIHTYLVTFVLCAILFCGFTKLEPNWGNCNADAFAFIGNYSPNSSLHLTKTRIAPILHSKGEKMVLMFNLKLVKVTSIFLFSWKADKIHCVYQERGIRFNYSSQRKKKKFKTSKTETNYNLKQKILTIH